jgi:hypothetical protein
MAKKTVKSKASLEARVDQALNAGDGILHLAPTWVPRSFLMPGKRIRLAEQDLYALGVNRGGIDERWFASTTRADNGPGTAPDEGLSYVVAPDGSRFLLIEAIATRGASIIGRAMMKKWGRWPLYCKFFDNMGPIPHHLHQLNKHARRVGQEHKPEAYYFPPQMNPVGNNFPYTFFGLTPDTSKQDIYDCLERWNRGDNGILGLSVAHKLVPGTGWLIPPGILHAPGSLCTYEVQWGSDVFAMYQNMVEGRAVGWDLLTKDVPKDRKHDLDYIVGMLDWDANINPNFKRDHYLEPIPIGNTARDGYVDQWVIYGPIHGEDLFSARELTVMPGRKVTIHDPGASGTIVIQGRGRIGGFEASAASFVRYSELTRDEFFITEPRATAGWSVENTGHEPLVILRYFGPDVNAAMPKVGDHRKRAGSSGKKPQR